MGKKLVVYIITLLAIISVPFDISYALTPCVSDTDCTGDAICTDEDSGSKYCSSICTSSITDTCPSGSSCRISRIDSEHARCIAESVPVTTNSSNSASYCYYIDWNNQCDNYISGCRMQTSVDGVMQDITQEECYAICDSSTNTRCQYYTGLDATQRGIQNCSTLRTYVEDVVYDGVMPGDSANDFDGGYVRVVMNNCRQSSTSCTCDVEIGGTSNRDQRVNWEEYELRGQTNQTCRSRVSWVGRFGDDGYTSFNMVEFVSSQLNFLRAGQCFPMQNPINTFSCGSGLCESDFSLNEVVEYSTFTQDIARSDVASEDDITCSSDAFGFFIIEVAPDIRGSGGAYECQIPEDPDQLVDSTGQDFLPFSLPDATSISAVRPGTSVAELIGRILSFLVGIYGSVTLVLVVYGGLTIMTSGSNKDKIQQGSRIIMWAAIAFLTMMSAYALVRFVLTFIV